MENTNLDEIIEKAKKFRELYIEKTIQDNKNNGIEIDEADLREQITIKPLGQIEIQVDGETVKKDVFFIEIKGEEIGKIYDEDLAFIAAMNKGQKDIMLSLELSSKPETEQTRLKEKLVEMDPNSAKTIKNLEDDKESEKGEEPENDSGTQEGTLPGIEEDEEINLTKAEVDRMSGPMTFLNQEIEGATMANVIGGLTGAYIKFVNADEIRKIFPNVRIPANQRTVPLEVFPDGSARKIGEDKLALSQQEGTNSNREHTVLNEDGQMEAQQMMETFKIVNKGNRDMQEISISYDENGGKPLEIQYGWRNSNNETVKVTLENVNSGRVTDNGTREDQSDTSYGNDKPSRRRNEDCIKLAKAKGYYIAGESGNPVLDVKRASEELSQDGRPVDEIIREYDENEAFVPGMRFDPRRG